MDQLLASFNSFDIEDLETILKVGKAHNFRPKQLPPSLAFELAKSRIKARYQSSPKDNITYYQHQLHKQQYAIEEAAQYGLALSFFEVSLITLRSPIASLIVVN